MDLRYVHLATHLKTPALLFDEQIARYNRLRGHTADPWASVSATTRRSGGDIMAAIGSDDIVLSQALDVYDGRFAAPRDIVLKPGEFSVHDVYPVHGAEPNNSGRRGGLTFRYMPSTAYTTTAAWPVARRRR